MPIVMLTQVGMTRRTPAHPSLVRPLDIYPTIPRKVCSAGMTTSGASS
jgi:hypothetical protein